MNEFSAIVQNIYHKADNAYAFKQRQVNRFIRHLYGMNS